MPDGNPTVGIILARGKDELLVKYATYGMDSNLFVSKYELYLPNRDELKLFSDTPFRIATVQLEKFGIPHLTDSFPLFRKTE